jgi:hypothetical protein
MTRSGRAIPSKAPAKQWVTMFALLAFFLQGLAVQTHVHLPIQPVTAQPVGAKATPLPAPIPIKDQDPLDQCRLCQELVHAGTFVTPTATTLLVGLSFVTAIFVALPAFAGAAARPFAWQSRAPPRR